MRHGLIYTSDIIGACIFAVLAIACIYGVAANGAWWHIGTAAICIAMTVALCKDAITNEGEMDLE